MDIKIQLKSIVERFKQHSNKLDNYALLTDQPWITRTENESDRCVLIFRKKENELIISLNGKVEKGKWDYIPSMNSLLVELKSGTVLYNQGFFDDSIMILKVDGTEDYQLFANENRINGTIEKLLENIKEKYLAHEKNKINLSDSELRKRRIVIRKLKDGRNFEIQSSLKDGYMVGDNVTIDGNYPADGEYKFGFMNYLKVKDGKIFGL